MDTYIILLLIILIAIVVDHSTVGSLNLDRKSDRLLKILFLSIFLLCVLRSSSVGRDVPGYERAYEMTKSVAWNDYNYIYFENGYILLMKVCLALGMNFQWFLVVVYTLILTPIYLFIKKYSADKCISCLIYVCYMIFEFDLTGIRQAIAMSIVLLAFMCLLNRSSKYILKYIIIVLIASTFHTSALICLIVLPLSFIKDLMSYSIVIGTGTILSLVSRRYLLQYVKTIFEKDSFNLDAPLYFGSNLFFLVTLAVLFLLVLRITCDSSYTMTADKSIRLYQNKMLYKVFVIGIMIAIFFGSETSARSFMFFSQVVMVLLPNIMTRFEKRSSAMLKLFFVAFFICFFFMNTLRPNNFDIVPYTFFWQ